MSKTTYIATAPDGTIGKRTTENRIYTHAVIGRHSYEKDLAGAHDKGSQKADGQNWDYHMALAAGTHEHCKFQHLDDDAHRAEWAAFAAAFPTRAGYIETQHAARVARVQDRKAEGYYEVWHTLTWCGRLDLAQKQIGANSKYWVDLQVVPAVEKGSK